MKNRKKINIGDILKVDISLSINNNNATSVFVANDKVLIGVDSGEIFVFAFTKHNCSYEIVSKDVSTLRYSDRPVVYISKNIYVYQNMIFMSKKKKKIFLKDKSENITCCTQNCDFYGTDKGNVYYGNLSLFTQPFLIREKRELLSSNAIVGKFLGKDRYSFRKKKKSKKIVSIGLSRNSKFLFISCECDVVIYNIHKKQKVAGQTFESIQNIRFLCASAIHDKVMFFTNGSNKVVVWGKNGINFISLKLNEQITGAIHYENEWFLCSTEDSRLILYNILAKNSICLLSAKKKIVGLKKFLNNDVFVFVN